MTDHYAVMGNPIAHSKSPLIHAAFARQTQQDMDYRAILVPLEGFADALDAFQQERGRGLNVTVPFKREAWEQMDERSERAQLAGAVNTVLFTPDGRRFGDNTDGVGLVRDLLENLGGRIAGRRVLVLGAGGAARGVLGPVLNQRPDRVVIANRTPQRAVELAGCFPTSAPLEGCGFDALQGRQFDLILNATAAGLDDEVPAIPEDVLAPGGWCYDLLYADTDTAFVRWGREHGAARSVDGLGMLVEQAAESFYLWRGVRPHTAEVIASLRGR